MKRIVPKYLDDLGPCSPAWPLRAKALATESFEMTMYERGYTISEVQD